MRICIISLLIFFVTQFGFSEAFADPSTNSQGKKYSDIEGYAYNNTHHYPEGLGYSLRYIKLKESEHYADVYVWPTQDNASLAHKELVYNITRQSVGDIFAAEEKGYYVNVKVVDQGVSEVAETVTTKSTITFLKNNLSILSFLYVTEFDGNFIKVRISLKKNEYNLARKDIDTFATKVLFEMKRKIDNDAVDEHPIEKKPHEAVGSI